MLPCLSPHGDVSALSIEVIACIWATHQYESIASLCARHLCGKATPDNSAMLYCYWTIATKHGTFPMRLSIFIIAALSDPNKFPGLIRDVLASLEMVKLGDAV